MSSKDRLWVALAIIVLIAIAMFTSFGRNLFTLNTPSVVLPDTSNGGSGSTSVPNPNGSNHVLQHIRVTPDTVQDVIASLQRTDSYHRELSVSLFWEGGSSTSPTSVWCNEGWISTKRTLPTGIVRHDLVGDEIYYWYDNDTEFLTAPADEFSQDLAQRIPTYETILALDTDNITVARYQIKETLPTIYVESVIDKGTSVERYWVSTQTGLLVGAEIEVSDVLIYSMSGYTSIQTPVPTDAPFTRPDGVSVVSLSP